MKPEEIKQMILTDFYEIKIIILIDLKETYTFVKFKDYFTRIKIKKQINM